MDKLIYWLWLSLACSPSAPTFAKLIKDFDDAEAIYKAEGREISSVVGYRCSDRSALENKSLDKACEIFEFCKKHQVGLLCYNDVAYPQSLREINTPPVLLYYRGTLPDFNNICSVSTVGTRSLTDYGRKNAFNISYDLACAGVLIVSGMAMGIDAVCHVGALSAGGKTVAVIGSGIDVCYPSQHLHLARAIVKNGCVMTEFAPGTQPSRYNFPKRNRIISGLSCATVVFEGEEKSGALITARYALEQKRSLFALPGNVGSKKSELPNMLIKDKAKACTKAEDIISNLDKKYCAMVNPFLLKDKPEFDMMAKLAEYQIVANCPNDNIFQIPFGRKTPDVTVVDKTDDVPVKSFKEPPENFDKDALAIYKMIPAGAPCSIESLVTSDANLRDVMKRLLKLEMGGFVDLLPGEKVSRKLK